MHSHSSFMKETLVEVYRLGALNVTYNYGNAAIITTTITIALLHWQHENVWGMIYHGISLMLIK